MYIFFAINLIKKIGIVDIGKNIVHKKKVKAKWDLIKLDSNTITEKYLKSFSPHYVVYLYITEK